MSKGRFSWTGIVAWGEGGGGGGGGGGGHVYTIDSMAIFDWKRG